MQNNAELDSDILQSLGSLFRECNAFAKSYEMMHREIKIQQQLNEHLNGQDCNHNEPELNYYFH